MRDNQTVICYAEGNENAWEAICLNFDIAVQGSSAEDVVHKLGTAISDYVDYVHTLPQAEQKRFLTRRVPWYIRLKVVLKALHAVIYLRRHDSKGRLSYSVPCTA